MSKAKVSWLLCIGRLVSKTDNVMHFACLVKQGSVDLVSDLFGLWAICYGTQSPDATSASPERKMLMISKVSLTAQFLRDPTFPVYHVEKPPSPSALPLVPLPYMVILWILTFYDKITGSL